MSSNIPIDDEKPDSEEEVDEEELMGQEEIEAIDSKVEWFNENVIDQHLSKNKKFAAMLKLHIREFFAKNANKKITFQKVKKLHFIRLILYDENCEHCR